VHELSFRFKRAHLRAVAEHLPRAQRFGLTPARFDVMMAIWEENGCALQIGIARRLGLSPTTICKMVKVMEAAGLVERSVHLGDLRQRWVMFTRRGLECIVGAIKAFIRGDEVRKIYDAVHEEGREFVRKMVGAVRLVGRALGDWSTQWYRDDAPSSFENAVDDERCEEMVREIERRAAHARASLLLDAPPFLAAAAAVGAARDAGEAAAAIEVATAAATAAAAAANLAPPTPSEVDMLVRISHPYWEKVNERRYLERMGDAAHAESADGATATPTATATATAPPTSNLNDPEENAG